MSRPGTRLQTRSLPSISYGNITLYVGPFHTTSAKTESIAYVCSSPHISIMLPQRIQFGLSPFRSLLIRGSQLISFRPPTQMFPSGGFAFHDWNNKDPKRIFIRKSYSGIPGSKVTCTYPGLIAACHALLRPSSQAIHQTASARRMIN